MDGYRAGEECARCGGRCCRERGCSLSSEDMLRALSLGADEKKDRIKEALLRELSEKNLYAIDSFHDSGRDFYYLRARHKCYTFIGVEAMGECAALTESGCALPEEERPKGGRFLESKPDGGCVQHYTKEEMLRDWDPYQPVLKEIWDAFYPVFLADGTFDACDEAYFAWMRERGSARARHPERSAAENQS